MTNQTSFAGKYAIVTGSTQGLGEAIARLFVERGAAGIIICGRNAERGAAVAAAADRHFGTIHILVNAAGVSDRGTIWDTSPELWDWIMAINVRAPFLLI